MKPVIGVMPLWDDEKDSIWMLPGYMDGIHSAGGIPVILPFVSDEAEAARLSGLCSGYLFTGGHDVSPSLYHETPLEGLTFCCEKRDRTEALFLQDALRKGRPVLGICRGIQFINAALGGTLYQDLPLQHPSDIRHHQRPPYDLPAHDVFIQEGTPLHTCLKTGRLSVNSYHHQAVRTLADGLEAMAVSPDGLVEAACLPEHPFLWAVQWHPEYAWKTDENSRKIFRAFVDAAAR